MHTCLQNLGNTCFINAVLQCLLHIPELNHWLDIHANSKLLTQEYDSLRKLMLQGHSGITPSRFVSSVFSSSKPFTPWQQQDAHEFLLKLIDEMDCNLFLGKQWSHVDTTKVEESFTSLAIPIVGHTLDECMSAYFKPEEVDWNNKRVVKKNEMTVYPVILCIALKRFNNKNEKNKAFVQIQHVLTLQETNYELLCICNHFGNTNGGHYTATVLMDKWYEFNDARVNGIDQPVTANAYFLLFRKIK